MKLIEHLQGTGVVTVADGNEVRANYDIKITQEDPGADTSPVVRFKRLGGQVWSEHDAYFILSHVRTTMTLRMEDGRRFKFFHRDLAGNIGLKEWIG